MNLLGELKEFIGNLDRVTQVLKLLCMVNTADVFHDTSGVCDGASDLLRELYGENGRHQAGYWHWLSGGQHRHRDRGDRGVGVTSP